MMSLMPFSRIAHVLALLCLLIVSCCSSSDRPWLIGTPTALPFLSKEDISPDTSLYHFALPTQDLSLGISTCSCILVSPPKNLALTRPYTPISSRHETGRFTLLVKRYPQGAMSSVFAKLHPGRDSLLFRQLPGNIKIQYPFDSPSSILMLAAGTGITPMYQALLRMFGEEETEQPTTRVVLVFACRRDGMYLEDQLNDMKNRFPNHLRIIYAISPLDNNNTEEGNTKNDYYYGPIVKDLLLRTCQEENIGTKDTDKVFVCGPPSFYQDFCGPRDQSDVRGVLQEMGFTSSQVVKF